MSYPIWVEIRLFYPYITNFQTYPIQKIYRSRLAEKAYCAKRKVLASSGWLKSLGPCYGYTWAIQKRRSSYTSDISNNINKQFCKIQKFWRSLDTVDGKKYTATKNRVECRPFPVAFTTDIAFAPTPSLEMFQKCKVNTIFLFQLNYDKMY